MDDELHRDARAHGNDDSRPERSSTPATDWPQDFSQYGKLDPKRTLAPASATTADLCDQCKQMNLLMLFKDPQDRFISQIGPGLFSLKPDARVSARSLLDIQKNPSCPLCQYFLQILDKISVPEMSLNDPHICVVPAGASHLLMLKLKKSVGGIAVYLILWIDLPPKDWQAQSRTIRSRTCLGILRDLHSGALLFSRQAQTRKETLDIARLKSWILPQRIQSRCLGLSSTTTPENPLFHLRLIDVQKAVVVPAAGRPRYVALSYVWGDSHQHRPDAEGRLSKLPQTVKDAIKVTAAIGIQYLWVDAYCLDQEESFERSYSLRNMHKIYNEAFFTIFALSNKSADDGLPGLHANTRNRSSDIEFVLDYEKISCFTPKRLVDHFKEAYWSTRGWTLQEAYFSTRRLCFTREEVFYWDEDWSLQETIVNHGRSLKWSGVLPLSVPELPEMVTYSGNWNFEKYASLVELYRKRHLTFETDSLAAFEGILTHLGERHNVTFLFGLPVDVNNDLWRSVMWEHDVRDSKHKGIPSRIRQFPSWSWAGWSGPVTYLYGRELPRPPIFSQSFLSSLTPGQISVHALVASVNLIRSGRSTYHLQIGKTESFHLYTQKLYNNCLPHMLAASALEDAASEGGEFWPLFKAMTVSDVTKAGLVSIMILEVVDDIAYRLAIVEMTEKEWSGLHPAQQTIVLG